jgi:hypothetical protein
VGTPWKSKLAGTCPGSAGVSPAISGRGSQ